MYNQVKKLIDYFYNNVLDEDHRCPFRSGYYIKDYKSDIKEFEEFSEEDGEKFIHKNLYGSIGQFIKDYNTEIFSDPFFTGGNGFIDTLLYTYDSNALLSGEPLVNYSSDEHCIKYFYGYQNYDLGLKYLLQNYDTVEDFYFDCAKNFPLSIENEFYVENVEKIQHTFSLYARINSGSICVIDLNKFYDETDKSDKETRKNFINRIHSTFKYYKENNIEDNLTPFNYRYFQFQDLKMMLIGFGDIKLNNIPDGDIINYYEKIDIQNNAKKYNL